MGGAALPYVDHPAVRAALFDIDGTLTSGGEVWDRLVKSPAVTRRQRTRLYAAVLPHYLLARLGIASQGGFRDRWVRGMARLMQGWREDQVREMCGEIVECSLVPALRPDVARIVQQHLAQGRPVILVSTLFEEIVQAFAAHLGAETGLGTRLELREGHCTGRIVGLPCSGARKLDRVSETLQVRRDGISLRDCAAYADSRSDIPLLRGVGYPVATYPDEGMAHAAAGQGWTIYPPR